MFKTFFNLVLTILNHEKELTLKESLSEFLIFTKKHKKTDKLTTKIESIILVNLFYFRKTNIAQNYKSIASQKLNKMTQNKLLHMTLLQILNTGSSD